MDSLFDKPKTKKELVYEFIKSKGRAKTHEVISYGLSIYHTRAERDARNLAEEGLIWRVREEIARVISPDSKEAIWSVHLSDKATR